MHNQQNLISAAMTCLLTMSIATPSSSVYAANEEQCFGVAQAGQNACNSNKSKHSCAGHSKVDNDPSDYIMLPQGSCLKIGGKLEPEDKIIPAKTR